MLACLTALIALLQRELDLVWEIERLRYPDGAQAGLLRKCIHCFKLLSACCTSFELFRCAIAVQTARGQFVTSAELRKCFRARPHFRTLKASFKRPWREKKKFEIRSCMSSLLSRGLVRGLARSRLPVRGRVPSRAARKKPQHPHEHELDEYIAQTLAFALGVGVLGCGATVVAAHMGLVTSRDDRVRKNMIEMLEGR